MVLYDVHNPLRSRVISSTRPITEVVLDVVGFRALTVVITGSLPPLPLKDAIIPTTVSRENLSSLLPGVISFKMTLCHYLVPTWVLMTGYNRRSRENEKLVFFDFFASKPRLIEKGVSQT